MTSENQPPDGDFSTPKQEAPELGLDFLAGLLRGKVHLTAIHDNKPMKARIGYCQVVRRVPQVGGGRCSGGHFGGVGAPQTEGISSGMAV